MVHKSDSQRDRDDGPDGSDDHGRDRDRGREKDRDRDRDRDHGFGDGADANAARDNYGGGNASDSQATENDRQSSGAKDDDNDRNDMRFDADDFAKGFIDSALNGAREKKPEGWGARTKKESKPEGWGAKRGSIDDVADGFREAFDRFKRGKFTSRAELETYTSHLAQRDAEISDDVRSAIDEYNAAYDKWRGLKAAAGLTGSVASVIGGPVGKAFSLGINRVADSYATRAQQPGETDLAYDARIDATQPAGYAGKVASTAAKVAGAPGFFGNTLGLMADHFNRPGRIADGTPQAERPDTEGADRSHDAVQAPSQHMSSQALNDYLEAHGAAPIAPPIGLLQQAKKPAFGVGDINMEQYKQQYRY